MCLLSVSFSSIVMSALHSLLYAQLQPQQPSPMPLTSCPSCPFHRRALAPLPCSREPCERCRCAGSIAVLGCPQCGFAVCRWCFVGGHGLFETIARAEAALAELRVEVARLKAGVDGDVFVWV